MKIDQNNDVFNWADEPQGSTVISITPIPSDPAVKKETQEIKAENPDSDEKQDFIGFSDFKILKDDFFDNSEEKNSDSSVQEDEVVDAEQKLESETSNSEETVQEEQELESDESEQTEESESEDSSVEAEEPSTELEEESDIPVPEDHPAAPQTSSSLAKDAWFNLFGFTQEEDFLQTTKDSMSGKEYKECLKDYNAFFNEHKNLFPLLNKEISLFELFILKYFIDLVPNEQAILPKYVIQLNFDKLRAPAKMVKFWSKGLTDVKFTQNNDNQVIYFADEPSATIVANKIKSIETENSFNVLKIKSQPMTFKEDNISPLNNQSLIEYPLFSFENEQNKDIVASFNRLEDLVNLKLKKSLKNVVKAININEWTKSKWLAFLAELWDNINNFLTKKELADFEFDTPENIYSKLLLTKQAESGKFFVITDFSFAKKEFKKVSFDTKLYKNKDFEKRISDTKYLKQLKEIYNLIYYSWIRFFMKPQNEMQLKEQFSYNMYSFISDSKILTKSSSYLFKPECFLTYTPWAKQPTTIPTGEEISINKKSIEIKKVKADPFNLDQLNLLFAGQNINWSESDIICKAINNLYKNGWIHITNFKLYINQEISFYFNSLKSAKSDIFFKNVKEMFNHFWPKDVSTFFSKLKKILVDPFN